MIDLARPRPRTSFLLLTGVLVLGTGVATSSSYAAGHGTPPGVAATNVSEHGVTAGNGEARGFYDARTGQTSDARAQILTGVGEALEQPATTTFRKHLPGQTVLDMDGTTGTVRSLSRLDGFLTRPSHASAQHVALGYVRHHHAALGLKKGDLASFHLRRDYRDITGTHHLFYVQRIGGHTVLVNGLTASVDRRGHLRPTLGGSPISRSRAGRLPAPAARLTDAATALAAVRRSAGVTTGADLSNDSATEGLFVTSTGTHLAWETVVMSSARPSLSVVDASTGQLLLRQPLTDDESGESTGRAYRFYPSAPHGGKQTPVNFSARHWLSPDATKLSGNNSHTYSDVNDNNRPSPSEEVHPKSGHSWGYKLKRFHLGFAKSFCNAHPCSWNPNKAYSWKRNRAQNATQVFFFVNNWHDHLLNLPIGFTEAAGNFQAHNTGSQGKGGDAVQTQTDDGANTDIDPATGKPDGFPDGNHVDNANMSTPPDGHAPTMQMYLQHTPGTSYPQGDPFSPTNVGDEADTVYHEYTHGLSNRLNVDVQGRSTLGGVQAGAMGEAWSDWYAMDYLVKQGLQRDRPNKVDVRLFKYDGQGVNLDRTEPMDCKVGSHAKLCNGGGTNTPGGYTYADYGKVAGIPEVHADGEIWAQTLWSLRARLGSAKTESLVTRAMELAPYDPSFLDMRNAILVADTAHFAGKDRHAIWKVFASRGMGFRAGSLGGEDAQPSASFAVPPKHLHFGNIRGQVTDAGTGQPLKGVPVTLAFQGAGVANQTAVSNSAGRYLIKRVPTGRYHELQVNGQGLIPVRKSVKVDPHGATVAFAVRRDWAAASGGASITSSTGADYTSFGCGPVNAIDLSQASGWSTNTGPGKQDVATNQFVPKQFTVSLGHTVNVSQFAVDPSATCGDGASSSTGAYQIETSPDGQTWTIAATGAFTSADDGRLNPVTPTAGVAAIRYVRFTSLGNQTPDFATNCPGGGYGGCTYTDLTELEVLGSGQ